MRWCATVSSQRCAERPMDVVCTAGHVDHGKSALVRALTGMEPDRFEEERRRGLTIDIGFGWADLAAVGHTRTVAFVDLPGHERFIANMLAGAGPVETALFVVAADEGWKPQSTEHLQILDLLAVRYGVVAITKADAADEQQLAAAREQVAAHLHTTSLQHAPVVVVSARDGTGLDDLRSALVGVLSSKPAPASGRRPRLWVDRSFTIKGAGTVVTGTLTGGALRVGDDVLVLPARRQGRVRGLQSLKSSVEESRAGDRVAVNVSGISRDEVSRGALVTAAGPTTLTAAFDVHLRTVAGAGVGRRGAWHVHAGSGEWPATIRPLLGGSVTGEGFARVLLADPVPLVPGDRFVLRDAGRRLTVAGGAVLDLDPPAVRGTAQREQRSQELAQRAAALAAGDETTLLRLHVAERGAVTAEAACAVTDISPDTLADLAGAAGLLKLGDGLADPAAAAAWSSAVTAALRAYHSTHPDERAAPRDIAVRAAARAGCPGWAVADLLATLVRLSRVVPHGSGLRTPDHGAQLSPAQAQARTALLTALDVQPFAPPRLSEAAAAAGATPALVRELEAEGDLVRLGDDLVMTGGAVEAAAATLRRLHAEAGAFTASQARQALGTTRKFAMPLLEELDRRGITVRNGDVRDLTPVTTRPTDR